MIMQCDVHQQQLCTVWKPENKLDTDSKLIAQSSYQMFNIECLIEQLFVFKSASTITAKMVRYWVIDTNFENFLWLSIYIIFN